MHASLVGKENVASHSKSATLVEHPKGTTLLVPAAAWHALHMRVDDRREPEHHPGVGQGPLARLLSLSRETGRSTQR